MAGTLMFSSASIPGSAVSGGDPVACNWTATATGGDVSNGVVGLFLKNGAPGSVQTDTGLVITPCDASGNCSAGIGWNAPNPLTSGNSANGTCNLLFSTPGTYQMWLITGHYTTQGNIDQMYDQRTITVTVTTNPQGQFSVSISSQGTMTPGQNLPVQVTVTSSVAATRNPSVTLTALDEAGATVGSVNQTISMLGQTTAQVTMNIPISSTVAGATDNGQGTVCPTIE